MNELVYLSQLLDEMPKDTIITAEMLSKLIEKVFKVTAKNNQQYQDKLEQN